MNNPLVQRAQYYVNESNRLNEQLEAQHEYSRLLEAILEEILTEEEILEVRKGILNKIGSGLVAGACMLGSGCDSKPVEPEKTSQVQPEDKIVTSNSGGVTLNPQGLNVAIRQDRNPTVPAEPEKTSQVQPKGKSTDALNAALTKLETRMETWKQQKAMRLKAELKAAREQAAHAREAFPKTAARLDAEKALRDGKADPRD